MESTERVFGRSRLATLLVCILFAFVVSAAFAQDSAKTTPKLVIDPIEFDFGSVAQGVVVEHNFVLRNEGASDLHIQRIVPACGCTTSKLEKDLLAPAEETPLKVSFDTAGFSGDKVKTVRLFSNDPDQTTAVVTLRGTVTPEVTVEPRRVFFGDIVEGKPAERDITISVQEGLGIQVKSITSRSPDIILQEITSTPLKRVVRVVVKPETRPGEFRDRVVVLLEGGDRSSINIPIYGFVKGKVEAVPTALSFGVLESGENSKKVTIVARGELPFEVDRVSSQSPAISTSIKEIERGRKYEILVQVDGSKVSKALRSSIEISAKNKEQAPLSVSVYGIQPPQGAVPDKEA